MPDFWYSQVEWTSIEELEGKTLVRVEQLSDPDDYIEFETEDGEVYVMYHSQDCCESVDIEDISGDLGDLIGYPIISAYESSNSGENDWGSETWTFYSVATVKGSVTIRWYGSSNGYYSESVDFVKKKNI